MSQHFENWISNISIKMVSYFFKNNEQLYEKWHSFHETIYDTALIDAVFDFFSYSYAQEPSRNKVV